MSEENKRVVRRYFEELDRRKATPVDLCADRFTFYVTKARTPERNSWESRPSRTMWRSRSRV
jgi:hypothetical protein